MPLLRLARALLVSVSLLAALAAGADLRPFSEEALARSHLIPSVGRLVTYTLRLQAAPGRPLGGPVPVTLTVTGRPVARVQATVPAGGAAEVSLRWTPDADGWYDLAFIAQPPGGPPLRLALRVPVTARPTHFLWFGAPKRFQWCNVPTTVDTRMPSQVDWWLRRGALPCAWRGGVCYPKWTVEQFRQSYESTPWIAIDEVGGLDEASQKILTAVRAHKQRYPAGCRAVWFIGAHEYWRDYADCVDLFVPEVYLNYGSNHLGALDRAVDLTRAAGVMDKMIPGLGINIIYDNNKQPRVSPTKDDVLRQIRHLKTIAPELRGVGFFTSDSAAPGVAEYADQLCAEYYLNPVLTLVPGSLTATAQGGKLNLSVVVRNSGGMAASKVRVDGYPFYRREATTGDAVSVTLPQVAAGEDKRVTLTLTPQRRLCVYSVQLAYGGTTLTTHLWTMFGKAVPAQPPVLCLPPNRVSDPTVPLFGAAPPGATWNQCHQNDNPMQASAAAVLPGLPGATEDTVTWLSNEVTAYSPLAFRFLTVPTAVDEAPRLEGSRLRGSLGPGNYVLDVARDQLVSLKATPTGAELLAAPWKFDCTAWEGFLAPRFRPTAAGLEVTIPFANERATGYSRYFLYRNASVIRIERYFQPQGELAVTASSEGASFPQRGGTFALQPGEGGKVAHGELQDGTAYRDLLFGYTGGAPGPENATRAGWFDFAFDRDGGGGLGIAIERRWTTAYSGVGYDVTRYYDAGDWVQVLNLWGSKPMTVKEPQTQVVYLILHPPLDLRPDTVVAPAERLWHNLRTRAFPVTIVP